MQEQKGSVTRKRIINDTRHLINTCGYANTSINDIISHTGVKKGNLYFYFNSKEDLFYEIIQDAREKYLKRLAKEAKGNTAIEKIKNLTMSIYKFHKKNRLNGGCIFGNTALEMADVNTRFAALINNIFEEWKLFYSGIIQQGIDAGEFKNSINPQNIACHIISSLEGGIMLSRASKNADDLLQTINALHHYLEILSC